MPKIVDPQELDKIAALLAAHGAWLAIADIEQACRAAGLAFDRRTLQRRLSVLFAAGRIQKRGQGRASRYRRVEVAAARPAAGLWLREEKGEAEQARLPLSPEAAQVRELVRRPIMQRSPVGYHREFLEDYVPGRSWYLPEALREHLLALGRSPMMELPAGTYARDILGRLMIDLSWASSRLEGSTYSRLDTQNLIEFGHAAEGRDRREAQMILNHKAAIEMLVERAGEIDFDPFTFFNLHALLSDRLLSDPGASGRLRTTIVEIGGSVFYPLGVPQQVEECFRQVLAKARAIADPFEQAFFLMVQLPYLQPFLDVNKRVSRLGANIPLIRRNLSPLSFVDVPEAAYVEGLLGVYELNRVELLRDIFAWAYERSCQRYVAIKEALPDPDPLALRYRQELIEVVGTMVRQKKRIDVTLIGELAAPRVSPEDLRAFVAMAFNDLHHLHEGSVIRYRLSLAEYRAWKEALDAGAR